MACGICGGAGHNRRTCSFGSSGSSNLNTSYRTSYSSYSPEYYSSFNTTSYNSITSPTRRTVSCGNCGESGHNSRTCGRESTFSSGHSSYSLPQDIWQNSVLLPSQPATRTVTCGTCGERGHNSRTCGRRPSSTPDTNIGYYFPLQKSNGSISSTPPKSTRSVRDGSCGGVTHNSRTCGDGWGLVTSTFHPVSAQGECGVTIDGIHREVERVAVSHIKSQPIRQVTCSGCGGKGHNIRTCVTGSSSSYNLNINYGPPETSKISFSSTPLKSNGTVTCGKCGVAGHHSSTCEGGASVTSLPNHVSSQAKSKTATGEKPGRESHHGIRDREKGVKVELSAARHATCGISGGANSNEKPIKSASIRQITFSSCGEGGHNRRSCKSNDMCELNKPENKMGCWQSTASQVSEPRRSIDGFAGVVTCGICGKRGHKSRSCKKEAPCAPPPPTPPLAAKPLSPKLVTSRTCGSEGLHYGETSRRTHGILSENGPAPELIKCGNCGGIGHNDETCKNLSKPKPRETKWMKNEVRERFDEGPTKEDGPGWIYIYKKSNPQGKGEASLFKIGRSSGPPEQRIRAQEYANNENYDIIFTIQVPFHKQAETMVHRQLKHYRTPQENGDGKTEWFTGKEKYFQYTVKKVVGAINGMGGSLDGGRIEE